MPPYWRPRRLYKVCISSIVKILNKVCLKLAEKYGSYDVDECKRDINIIREFMTFNVLVNAMDDLYQEWRWQDFNYDTRIRAAAFMHKGMKTLMVLYGEDKGTAYSESSFWISQISYSNRITSLDLGDKCTDEILEGVSQYCFSLKYINIAPAIIAVTDKSDSDETPRYIDLVTDIGLRHLGKCKKLEAVEMSDYRTSTMAVTVQGVRKLLKDLPVVKYISFKSMGRVISEDMNNIESLKLMHFCETRPEAHHITALSKLCNNLKHICLYFRDTKTNHDAKASVLDSVTKSNLCISDFKLSNFGFDDIFVNLLRVKGAYLTRLTLDVSAISHVPIKYVGLYCANIRHLDIREFGWYEANMIQDLTFDKNTTMFSMLESLSLRGMFSDANIILPIILTHARKLKKLEVYLYSLANSDTVENTINNILKKNPLTELTKLHAGFYLHMPTLLYFIRLPYITNIWYWNHTRYITLSERDNMIKEELRNRFLFLGSIMY